MYDLFYILEVTPQWYNLLVRDTHCCIACGRDLEVFKRTIYNYVRKYKIEDRVYKALNGLSDGGRVPPTVFSQRQEDYTSGKHLVFNDLIRGVVVQALKENRKDTPYHHAKKKVRTVPHNTVAVASHLPPTNEVRAVKKIRPLLVKRTIVLSTT